MKPCVACFAFFAGLNPNCALGVREPSAFPRLTSEVPPALWKLPLGRYQKTGLLLRSMI